MPQGKNNTNKRANPKKKGQRNNSRVDSGSGNTSARAPGEAPSVASSATASTASSELPSFASFGIDEERFRPKPNTFNESVYARYKKSTQRVKEVLQSMVPAEIFETNSVHALVDATDYIVEHELKVDGSLLSDLLLSIRVRKKFARKMYGGGDEGHSYFIEVLVYCWTSLQPTRKKQVQGPQEPDMAGLSNRFEGFSTEHDAEDTDEEDDEDDLPQSPQPRPQRDATARLTLDELILGTAHDNCVLFILTLNELAGINAVQYAKLNEICFCIHSDGQLPSFMVGHLIQLAVFANASIQQVEAFEEAFVRDNPHLNSVYRVFATLMFGDLVRELTKTVVRRSPIASQFSEDHAIAFLVDAMESLIRGATDRHSKRTSLVSEFLERWQFQDDQELPSSGYGSVAGVFCVVGCAVAMEFDQLSEELRVQGGWLGQPSHSWLGCEYIGNKRSIANTIKLLQMLSTPEKLKGGSYAIPKGSFGVAWGDRSEAATRIQVDMDELLMVDIVPVLIELSTMLTCLPYNELLFSGLSHFKRFIDHPERPVSWTLSFSVHLILTAILEVQGPHSGFLADTAERAFGRFFEQLEHVHTVPRALPQADPGVKVLQKLQVLAQLTVPQTREEKRSSLWNPYCAGVLLLYMAYIGNLELGTKLVDSNGQLRMTLHLFNALKQAKVLRPGQIELLDRISVHFEGCHDFWKGRIPKLGEFHPCWTRAFGSYVLVDAIDGIPRRSIDPNQLTTSYRRVLQTHGAIDTYKRGRHRGKRYNPLSKFIDRSNDTFDALWDDEQLLATNLTGIGLRMHQFCARLITDAGWMPLLESIKKTDGASYRINRKVSADYLKCYYMSRVVAEKVFLPLDAGDTAVAAWCVESMINFFSQISADEYMWFIPECESSSGLTNSDGS